VTRTARHPRMGTVQRMIGLAMVEGLWGEPDDVRAAAQRIAGAVERTPLLLSRTLSRRTGAEVWFKFENLQFTASFKERGALNRLLLLPQAERQQLRQVSDLRFASDLAPYAFSGYLAKDRKGVYTVARLPAESDPVVQRMQRVRERDYALVDTLNEYYASFGGSMAEPYTSWRKFNYEELEAESQAKREALTRQVLGAVAVVGGIVAGAETSSSAASAAATAAVIGGMYAFKSGLDKRAEIKLHSESLKQLGDSFQSEVQPMVVDVEGRTLQLTGSAEQQYAEWRQLLRQLYENETGLPADPGVAATGSPSPGTP